MQSPLEPLEEPPPPSPSGRERRRSPKAVYYAFQMFLSFAQNLSFQYLPIFALKLGASSQQMGLLTAVQNVGSTAFSPVFGRWSDRRGRKIFLIMGAFIAFASATTYTLAQNPTQVIISVGVNAFGLSILIPAWNGALADYTEGGKRGGFMGRLVGVSYIYVTIALGAIAFVTPVLPYSEVDQYRIVMGLSAVNFLLAVVLSYILIDLKEKKTGNGGNVFMPLRDRNYRRFLVVILFWWFWMSLAWSYFPTVISEVVLASPAEVAYIAITATIVQAFASYRLADTIDRIGTRRSIIYGFLTFAVVPINFALATEWWHLIPAQIIAGIGIGFGFTALQTYIIEIGKSENAGNYQGVYNLLWGAVTFVGSYFGGYVLEWGRTYFGSLSEALTILLFGIAGLRFFSTFILYFFLPDPVSNLNS